MSFEKGLKSVIDLTGTSTKFVQWVAGLLRERKWVEILMLVAASAVGKKTKKRGYDQISLVSV